MHQKPATQIISVGAFPGTAIRNSWTIRSGARGAGRRTFSSTRRVAGKRPQACSTCHPAGAAGPGRTRPGQTQAPAAVYPPCRWRYDEGTGGVHTDAGGPHELRGRRKSSRPPVRSPGCRCIVFSGLPSHRRRFPSALRWTGGMSLSRRNRHPLVCAEKTRI